jgi:hypothetical protein
MTDLTGLETQQANPDPTAYSTGMEQLAREQAIAQAMYAPQEQPQGQMISGHYVAPNPLYELANVIRRYKLGQTMGNVATQAMNLRQQQMQGMGNWLRSMPNPNTATQQTSDMPDQTTGQPMTQTVPGATPEQMRQWAASGYQYNPQLAEKMMENYLPAPKWSTTPQYDQNGNAFIVNESTGEKQYLGTGRQQENMPINLGSQTVMASKYGVPGQATTYQQGVSPDTLAGLPASQANAYNTALKNYYEYGTGGFPIPPPNVNMETSPLPIGAGGTSLPGAGEPVVNTGAAGPAINATNQAGGTLGQRAIQYGATRGVPPKDSMELEQQRPSATQSYVSTAQTMQRISDTVDKILANPGLNRITGWEGKLPNWPGGQASDLQALVNSLTSQQSIAGLESLRDESKTGAGLGRTTQNEFNALSATIANLTNAQSPESFSNALRQAKSFSQQIRSQMGTAYNTTYGYTRNGQAPPQALAHLAQNPSLLDAFIAKYGYSPYGQ